MPQPWQLSPINVDRLKFELRFHPDRNFVTYLVNGISDGFDTGIETLPSGAFECKNNLSARRDKQFVTEALLEEVVEKFMEGPFSSNPFEGTPYRVSPLGVACHKYSGRKRLILDLSAPHNSETPSINSLIDKERFRLKYVTVDNAIAIIKTLGQHTLLSKFDIKSAFKLLPIRPDLYRYHCVLWEKMYYFFTKLPFGSRSSPAIFTNLSKAVHFIATTIYGIDNLLYLLDDFLVMVHKDGNANDQTHTMKRIFDQLSIPLNMDKTEGPVCCLTYLGVEIDTHAMQARLPQSKLCRIRDLLQTFLKRKSCTKQQLLSLLGHLSFASRVAVGGRPFVASLIELSTTVANLHDFVQLSLEVRQDIAMWSTLLAQWNGVSMFHDDMALTPNDLTLFTDSSSTYGFGAYFKTQEEFFMDTWENHPPAISTHSLSYLELIPILCSCLAWPKLFSQKRIIFLCDNEGSVAILNKGRSKCKAINSLMRTLMIQATLYNFIFTSRWISTKVNIEADLLSRGHLSSFQTMAPHATRIPCPSPQQVSYTATALPVL